jgi:putative sterol carrier protein
MATSSELIERISATISKNPGIGQDFGAVYKFVLEGADGGTWLVNLKDKPGVAKNDGPADVTLSMNATDFVDLLEGRANGQQLYFQGKLRIDGNIGLALKLQNLAALAQ